MESRASIYSQVARQRTSASTLQTNTETIYTWISRADERQVLGVCIIDVYRKYNDYRNHTSVIGKHNGCRRTKICYLWTVIMRLYHKTRSL